MIMWAWVMAAKPSTKAVVAVFIVNILLKIRKERLVKRATFAERSIVLLCDAKAEIVAKADGVSFKVSQKLGNVIAKSGWLMKIIGYDGERAIWVEPGAFLRMYYSEERRC